MKINDLCKSMNEYMTRFMRRWRAVPKAAAKLGGRAGQKDWVMFPYGWRYCLCLMGARCEAPSRRCRATPTAGTGNSPWRDNADLKKHSAMRMACMALQGFVSGFLGLVLS